MELFLIGSLRFRVMRDSPIAEPFCSCDVQVSLRSLHHIKQFQDMDVETASRTHCGRWQRCLIHISAYLDLEANGCRILQTEGSQAVQL